MPGGILRAYRLSQWWKFRLWGVLESGWYRGVRSDFEQLKFLWFFYQSRKHRWFKPRWSCPHKWSWRRDPQFYRTYTLMVIIFMPESDRKYLRLNQTVSTDQHRPTTDFEIMVFLAFSKDFILMWEFRSSAQAHIKVLRYLWGYLL